MSTETETIHPPLTGKEFYEGCGHVYEGVPICEDEHGTCVYGYGHIEPETFVRVVNAHDREEGGLTDDEACCEPKDVRHVWAVTLKPADDPEGWWIQWGGVTADTPQAFAMTVVDR